MQYIVKNNDLRVTCNVKLLENVQASKTAVLSGGGCCTVALSKHINGFITPESLVKSGCATIIVADNANESGSKMFQIPISGNQMISFLDSNNRIVVLAVGKSNIQFAISTSPFSMGQDLVFEKRDDVFKSDFITEIDDVKYRRIPLDTGRYVDKILIADKNKKVYTLEYDCTKSAFSNRREIRSMEKVMDGDGLWAFYVSFVGENPEYTPADFMYYSNASNLCYTASDSIMTQDENHTDKNDMGFSHVNCIVPYGVYNGSKMQTESLLFAAAMKDSQRHRIYLQYAGVNTDVDDAIDNNPNADIYDISALAANDRDVSFVCAIGEDGDNHNVLYTGVIPNDYYSYKKSGMVRELSPIYSGVSAVFPCQASDNILTGFFVLDDATLVRFIYSLSDDSIITRPVEIDVNDNDKKIPTFNCYHTQLDLTTTDGTPIPSGIITITSPYTCLFEIMGKRYAVKENHPLEITDIVSPTLYIAQYADEIYSSEFNVNFCTKNIEGKEVSISCTINPSAENEDRISSMTPDSWCDAKKQDGGFLIPDDYRTSDNMKALNNAISKITKATSCPTIKVEDCVKARKLSAENITEFALLFDDNHNISYSEKDIHQLYLSLKDECRDGSQLTGIFGWAKKKLSSVIKAASKNIVKIAKVVVAKVEDTFHTVVEFFKDGVRYIIEEILDFVSKAYDTVTAIFTRISVCFQDFMDWLGQLLHWDEVKDNAALVKKTFYKAFDSWQTAACGGIGELQKGIGQLSKSFKSALENLKTKCGEMTVKDIIDRLVNGKTEQLRQDIGGAMTNNIFAERLVCSLNPTAKCIWQQKLDSDFTNIFDDIVKVLEDTFSKVSNQTKDFVEYLKDTNVQDLKLSKLIEYLIAISEVPSTLADGFLKIIKDSVAALFDAIKGLLEAKIDIPFFSWLFTKISGAECNMINIISLIVAVPYKAVEKIFGGGNTLRKSNDNDDDGDDTHAKVLATICAITTPLQKMIDKSFTAVSIVVDDIGYFKQLNALVAAFNDAVSIVSWTIMTVAATNDSTLKNTSRICFCVCGFVLSIIDLATYFSPSSKVDFCLAMGGGIAMVATGIISYVCYCISEGDIPLWENVYFDCESIIASGLGNFTSVCFLVKPTDVVTVTIVAVGMTAKTITNYLSVIFCWISCYITYHPPKGNEPIEFNFFKLDKI